MTQKVHFLCAVVEGPGCHNGYSESCWEPRVPGIPDPHGLGSDIPPGLLADALRHDIRLEALHYRALRARWRKYIYLYVWFMYVYVLCYVVLFDIVVSSVVL